MHLILQPIPLVRSAIRPHVESFALNVVSHELSLELGTILPEEHARPLFLPFDVLTLVSRPIHPCFRTLSVLIINIREY
jgi:hypothetical protein